MIGYYRKEDYPETMNLQIYFTTLLRGKFMGQDAQGNRYYQDRWFQRYGRPRRWVIYKGSAEASRVPSQWHAWLHHSVEAALQPQRGYDWEKPHQENMTGTASAHRPKGWSRFHKPEMGKPYHPWDPTA